MTDKISINNLIEIVSFKIFSFQIRLLFLDFQLILTVLLILIIIDLIGQLFLTFLMIDLLTAVNFLLIIMNSQITINRIIRITMLKNHTVKSLTHNNLFK